MVVTMAIRRVTDAQWRAIQVFLPEKPRALKGGRPWADDRRCLEGILWIMSTGAQWAELPRNYPSYSTCWRRLKHWQECGIFTKMWRAFLAKLNARSCLVWDEAFADGTFAPAKKGGLKVGKTKKGKGTKIMMITDGEGLPLAAHIDSASPAEVTLIETTLAQIAVSDAERRGRPRTKPDRFIADKAYDSNFLRSRLAKRGIQPIIPARSNNSRASHQDGRPLRRYKRRWKIERTFSWLQNFRRITTRWERLELMYSAFVNLACAFLVLRRL